MPVVVEISNPAKLKKAKDLLGAKTDGETLDLALEIVIKELEPESSASFENDLPEDFFTDLFAEKPNLSDGESIQAVIEKRKESNF